VQAILTRGKEGGKWSDLVKGEKKGGEDVKLV